MSYALKFHKKVFPILLRLHDDSWGLFYNQHFSQSLHKLRTFYHELHKYRYTVDYNNIRLRAIINSCNILYKNIYFLSNHNEIGFFQMPENQGILYYLLHDETGEVTDFYGQLYNDNTLRLKHIYNYINQFLQMYQESNTEVDVVLCLSDTKFSEDKICFDVYYQNEGTIHIELKQDGSFVGDCLFLFEQKEYIDDFTNKIKDIYQHLKVSYFKRSNQ